MRVVMFGGHPFCRNWFDSARLVADAVYLRPVDRPHTARTPGYAPVPSIPGLFRDPSDDRVFEYLLPRDLPYRVLGPLADRPNERALAGVLDHLAGEFGPAECLHGHFSSGTRMFPWLSRTLGVPYVVTEHSSHFTGLSPDTTVSRRGLRIAQRVFAGAACVIPVSEFLRDSLERRGLPGPFEVVPNPVDIDRLPRPGAYLGGPFRFVSVARLDGVKAVDVLLRAFAVARAEMPELRLTLVGGGRERDALIGLADELALGEAVEFAGEQANEAVPGFLADADAFVLASIVENLSVATIEALVAGLPVIATAVGGQPELVGAEDGFLVPPRNEKELAGAMVALAAGTVSFDRDQIAGRARARYSTQAVAAGWNRSTPGRCRAHDPAVHRRRADAQPTDDPPASGRLGARADRGGLRGDRRERRRR